MTTSVLDFLQSQLDTPSNQWSLGTFGAIAEFMRDPDEPATILNGNGIAGAATPRGAIRFDNLSGVRLVASESTSRRAWSHSVAFCLPKEACAMNRRGVITELGPDRDAVRPQDRDAVLFDLGLGTVQTDICVRTNDPAVIAALRADVGRSVFDPAGHAMAVILKHSPNRVFIARVGRVEVFAAIPPPHGKSPDGPHTHVLPKLLRTGQTHAATEPIPDDWVPCAHVYPAHPVKDAWGQLRPFDATVHGSFQRMLDAFGDPELVEVKKCAFAALRAGKDPHTIAIPDNRFARNSLRVAIVQWEALHGIAAQDAVPQSHHAMLESADAC
jgi:hypothetical protein